jgi:Asp-tRNA(Asn)/Glu-tRNA(Gln) amidotransferase A subunit family amidase
MPDFDEIEQRHNQIVAAEAARVHAEWYSRHPELYHPKTVELIERGQAASDEALAQALLGRENLRGELAALMDGNGVDVWISPAAPGPAPKGLDSTGSPVMNLPWTHSGLPTVGLPSGTNAEGLPMGLQVAARWYADELLLAWASEIERALRS